MIGVFRKRKKNTKKMAFSRAPKQDGLVDLAFGLPLAALWLLRCHELDCWTNGTTILSYIYLAFIIFGGAYKLLFRRGAIEDEVTLGGFYNRMYLRLGWLFVLAGLAACVVVYTAFVLLLASVDSGFTELPLDDLQHDSTATAWLLMLMMYRIVTTYFSFRAFYHSPEESRHEVDD